MSLPPYNPYAAGNQNPTQRQYGLPNTQTEQAPRRGSSFLEHGSIPSSSGAHFGIPEISGGMMPSSLNYRSDAASRMIRDEDTKSSMDMHISKTREEARLPVNTMHQHMEQGSPFARSQREDFRSSGTGMGSYPMASASSSRDTHQAAIQSGNTNFSWLTNCARPSSDGSVMKSSPAFLKFAVGDGEQFDTFSQGQNKMQAIPGLGDYENPASGTPEASAESKYTSESAASILQRFGLEKGDLEHLISYPEDQITPANLPFILRKIRLEKNKKTTAGPQPALTVAGSDSYSLSRAEEMRVEEASAAVLQPSKVIDYGHTGKYTAGAGGDIGRKGDKDNSGGSKSMFMMDTAANRPNLEPLQKNPTDLKSSALGSSRKQGSSFPSSSYGSAPSSVASPVSDQTKRLLAQLSPTNQNILKSFLFPKKDTATRGPTSEASKPLPVKQPEGDRQATKAPVPSTSSHGKHPSRPGLVLIGSNKPSDTKDSSKTKGKTSAAAEQTKRQGKQREQTQKQPIKQQQKTVPAKLAQKQPAREQPSKHQTKQSLKKPVLSTRKALPPTTGKSAPPTGVSSKQNKQLISEKQHKDKSAAPRDQPTPAMLFDYSATSPRIYPHTCSLCNKECTNMQDWISHQNSSLHLESCRLLRKQFPKWDGEIVLEPRAAGKDTKPSTSTSAKKTRRESHSRSKSPSPHHWDRKDKRKRSRSRSPQSSKYSRRYENPGISKSQSPERRTSPKRKDDRQYSPRRIRDRRSPARRSNESRSPPRRFDNRRTPPRRNTESWSPPRRSTETRSAFDNRQSPQRRPGNRWSPSRRSDKSRSPQRRSQERRSSREGSSSQPKGVNSAESLAKKLMETSAVQSLSDPSNLEAVVKTLAPALLAELAKMTTSSPSPPSSARQRKLSSSAPSSSKTKSAGKSLSNPKCSPYEVELINIHDMISLADLQSTVGQFGRAKSVKIDRSKRRAYVQFEKIEAVKKIKLARSFNLKRTKITVAQEKGLKKRTIKSATSSDGTTPARKVLLPTPGTPPILSLNPQDVIRARVPPVKQKAAAKDWTKASAKGVSGVNKAKVLVSKAKSVSTKINTKVGTKLASKRVVKTALSKAPETMPVNTDATGVDLSVIVIESDAEDAQMKDPVIEEKVVTTQKPEETVTLEIVEETAAVPSKSEASSSEEQLPPEPSDEGSAVGLKGTTEDDAVKDKTVPEPEKDPTNEKTVVVSQAETIPTPQRPQMDKPEETPVKDTKVPPRPPTAESSRLNQSQPKPQGSSEVQTDAAESGKASPPTMVKLHGICSSLSHSEVVSAVESFGKTKSVVLFRARLEAVVIFEKVEDAKKLKTVKSLDVNGTEIMVVGKEEAVSKEQKTPLLKKAASSAPSLNAPTGPTKGKVVVPVAQKVSTQPIIQTESSASESSVKKVELKQTTSFDTKSSESQPDPGDSKQTGVEESVVGLMDKPEVPDQAKGAETDSIVEKITIPVDKLPVGETVHVGEPETKVSGPDLQSEVETSKCKDSDKVDADEPMELEVIEVKAAEPEEDVICTDDSSKSQIPMSSSENQQKQTSVSQQGPTSEPEPTAQGPETRTETTQPTAGTSKDVIDLTLIEDAPEAAAVSAPKPVTSQQSSSAVTGPTIGEMLEKYLTPRNIYCLSSLKFPPVNLPKGYRQLLISGLPLYYEGFYTEADIVNVLSPFGLRDKNFLYIIPQSRMAIVELSSVACMLNLLRHSYMNGVFFRGLRLMVEVLHSRRMLTPAEFYKLLKKVLKCSTETEAQKTVFIRNISQRETKELRNALKEFAPIANFLPLLNKLYIEFESVPDACAFKSWYELRFPTLFHSWPKREVIRLGRATGAASANIAVKVSVQSPPSKNETATTSQEPKGLDSKPEPVKSETTTDTKPATETMEQNATEASVNQPESKPDGSETTDTKPATEAPSNKATEVSENQSESKPGPDKSETTKPATEASVNTPESKPEPDKSEDVKPATETMEQDETKVSVNQPESEPDKSEDMKPATEASENQSESKPEPDKTKPATETMEQDATEASVNQSESKPDKSETEAPSTEASENQPESGDSKEKPQTSENKTSNESPYEPAQGSVLESVSTLQEPQMEVGEPPLPHVESFPPNQEVNVGAVGAKDEAKVDKTENEGAETKAAAANEQKKPSAFKESSSAPIRPTIGEMLDTHLLRKGIYCRPSSYLSPMCKLRQLLISRLPPYHEGLYTEDDVANVLAPFGFHKTADTLFVIPQSCMAFATMPPGTNVFEIIRASETNGVYFQGNELLLEAVIVRSHLNAHKFYRFLKKLLKRSMSDEGERTIYIRNISQSETKALRDALREFAPVTNFMPLLNKLFIEFKSCVDAELFEAWYRQQNHAPRSEVTRLLLSGPLSEMSPKKDPKLPKEASLTHGEKFERFLTKKKIGSFKGGTHSPKILITWLEDNCCQTEDDMVKLLTPFGYQHKDHNIFIFPQACLAFVQMPTAWEVTEVLRASRRDPLMLNGTELSVYALNNRISLKPFWLYQTLMKLVNYSVASDRDRVIFIRNISESDFKKLREVLMKQGSVANILPLLNKVFIEFKTSRDADWLGVWYGFLKKPSDHRIQRLKIPYSYSSSPAPKVPEHPCVESEDLIDGVTLPSGKGAIPHGSRSPFWLTLRNSPFVFPTVSPWFIIPEYVTVRDTYGIEKAGRHGSMCPTVMLTGLPEGSYKHEDVARLVWPFFPKQNLHSLFYNVTVLPLQRRAFVFFADWTTCCEFLKAHIEKQNTVNGHAISAHVVVQNMYPEPSEEKMYKSLMKLTNAGVLDPSPLDERLLCVGVSEVSLDVITLIIEMVASITTFVNFLPLANRICIEMSDSSDVAKVVEKYNDLSPTSFTEDPAWSRVQHFENLENLRKRLQDSEDVTLKLDDDGESSPEIDKTSLKSIKVTVGEHRVVERSRSLSVERTERTERTPGDDFSDDIIPSDAFLFDELQLNEEDFVTVDEVYDDADRSPEPHRSSRSSRSPRRREDRDRTKDYKSSSRSTKDTRSSSSSSSKPTKSTTKPSSSTSAGKSASSSPPESTETPSSPVKSDSKTSSGSTSGEKANAESAAEQLSEGAVPPSDHQVSAEGSAPENVESEAKMEARREMQPPQQRPGSDLNQTQDLEMDLKVMTNRKQRKDEVEEGEKTDEDLSEHIRPTGSEGGLEVNPEEFGEMEVLDSVREDQEDGLALKHPSEEDLKMEKSAEEETNNAEESEEKKTKQEGNEVKDAETGQDQLLQEGGTKDDLKDPDGDVTDQAFEILDSIDDQNETNEGVKPKSTEGEEDDTYQVIDSVEEQPTSSESEKKQQRPRRKDATVRKEERPSRRSDRTSKAPKSVENKEQTAVFEIVDSVEEDAGRRRSTRGKKEPEKPEEVTYEVLDSVETATDEPAAMTTRSRRGRTCEDAKADDTPTRRRQTPARPSRSREKTPKKEEEKTEAFEILDSVECVQEDPPTTRGKGKRGRPKKQTQTVKNINTKVEKAADEDEATYQIVDSVEDELVEDQPLVEPTERKEVVSKNGDEEEKTTTPAEEAEEETVFQVLDCLEDEQVQEEQATTEGKEETKEEEVLNVVSEACEQVEETPPQKDEGNDDPPPAEAETEQTSPIRSQSVTVTLERETPLGTESPLNLEKVSDEEEDYPDDTAEEEELRKRQAAAKQKQIAKAERARNARAREERGKTRGRVEVESQELVTLDEVGADETEDETTVQALVTLDEFVEEEEEEKKGAVKPESGTLSQEEEPADHLNQETLVTLDEADFDEEDKQTKAAKRKHDDDTEESVNFVIVDEVKDDENREATPRTRGRPKKKPRQTPVRKSTRGKTESRGDDGLTHEPSSVSDNDPLKVSSDHEEVQETASQADVDPSTAEPELQLGDKTQEDGENRTDVKAVSKRRSEPLSLESKRPRSQSPSVPHDFLLPDFKPNNPLGKEFVVPGFFCNLCSVFYPSESTAKELHCSSQTHYNNLKKHYRKLQLKSRSSSRSCRESTSAGF